MTLIETLGKQAKEASKQLLRVSSQTKNHFLLELATSIEAESTSILEANKMDMEQAKEHGISRNNARPTFTHRRPTFGHVSRATTSC